METTTISSPELVDEPERIQMMYDQEIIGGCEEEMSTWIYDQLAANMTSLFGENSAFFFFFSYCRGKNSDSDSGLGINSITRADIARFLQMHLVDKLDIPFIAMYRKEECINLLKDPIHVDCEQVRNQNKTKNGHLKRHKVLWAICELFRKWQLLEKRKRALLNDCSRELRAVLSPPDFKFLDSIMSELANAKSETEVNDFHAKFRLHFSERVEVDTDEFRPYKRLKREEEFYSSHCRKAALQQAARIFGLSPDKFGLQSSLKDNTMEMDLACEDTVETPEEIASKYTCAEFDTPRYVLSAARRMAAVEISCEPCIRKYVRKNYLDIFEISTSPKTSDINVGSDYIFQRKPLQRFDNAQWLLVLKAEEENLIDITFEISEDKQAKLLSDLNKFYLGGGASKCALLWNEQRKLILQDAIVNFLSPLMEKEARSQLTSRAKNRLLMEYEEVFLNKVSVAPVYQPKKSNFKSDDEAAGLPRVMACCWGEAEITLVMLDSYGEVLDELCIDSFSWDSFENESCSSDDVTWAHNRDDEKRVLKFVTDHLPSVAVIGAVNVSCTHLRLLLAGVKARVEGQKTGYLCLSRIVYGDESLARLYECSQISFDQLPGRSGNVKRAVALGRYLQNPLAMVATLCGPGRDIVSWRLLDSPSEDFLTPDEKYSMIEQIMVDVTNQVGLDINLAIRHEWLFAPLQFISGLGPRKAEQLKQSLVRSGCSISSRIEFVTLHMLGERVYANAAGFLRVRPSDSCQFVDLLGDTRIHPESYILAQELAKDVLGDKDAAIQCMCIRDGPGCLEKLDIDAYAKSKTLGDKVLTLFDIKKELMQGFRDPRKQYEELSVDECFRLITGLDDDSIYEGKIVRAKVQKLHSLAARCITELGLVGLLLHADYIDGGRRATDLSKKMKEGDIIKCKIKTVKKRCFAVRLRSL